MTHDKPDHDRLLDLLKANQGRYYKTYELSAALNIMDNSVHRALDTLERKMGIAIDHKPAVTEAGVRVMSYAWLGEKIAHIAPKPLEQGHQESDNLCTDCNDSYWYRGKACAKCGALTGKGEA